ncbi:High affinity cAMP-specific 3',5'-cyclic phosphodiesterase 7A [Quaeritorhiza haematococci]|nr:High affinity cAMP-specific 3',5'-cyclic phosphodiesterase 7A [Quaeritorhiza haematococci]
MMASATQTAVPNNSTSGRQVDWITAAICLASLLGIGIIVVTWLCVLYVRRAQRMEMMEKDLMVAATNADNTPRTPLDTEAPIKKALDLLHNLRNPPPGKSGPPRKLKSDEIDYLIKVLTSTTSHDMYAPDIEQLMKSNGANNSIDDETRAWVLGTVMPYTNASVAHPAGLAYMGQPSQHNMNHTSQTPPTAQTFFSIWQLENTKQALPPLPPLPSQYDFAPLPTPQPSQQQQQRDVPIESTLAKHLEVALANTVTSDSTPSTTDRPSPGGTQSRRTLEASRTSNSNSLVPPSAGDLSLSANHSLSGSISVATNDSSVGHPGTFPYPRRSSLPYNRRPPLHPHHNKARTISAVNMFEEIDENEVSGGEHAGGDSLSGMRAGAKGAVSMAGVAPGYPQSQQHLYPKVGQQLGGTDKNASLNSSTTTASKDNTPSSRESRDNNHISLFDIKNTPSKSESPLEHAEKAMLAATASPMVAQTSVSSQSNTSSRRYSEQHENVQRTMGLLTLYNVTRELDKHKDTARINDYLDLWYRSWNCDMFQLAEMTQGHPLYFSGLYAVENSGILAHFKIELSRFKPWLLMLESGYNQHPYHNCIHAADVLHSLNYLILEDENLRQHFSHVELFAAMIAAIGHDIDHPGLNNNFLVKSRHPRALLYSDTSVNEYHHSAQIFLLSYDSPFNIFADLCTEEYEELRKIIIKMVLATDMAKHFEYLNKFKTKMTTANIQQRMDVAENRMMVLEIGIKCADLNNPTKTKDLSRRWSEAVMEEFYLQGDKERELGLPISQFMDRHNQNVAKCQIGFIDIFVLPLYDVWAAFNNYNEKSSKFQREIGRNRQHWTGMNGSHQQIRRDSTPSAHSATSANNTDHSQSLKQVNASTELAVTSIPGGAENGSGAVRAGSRRVSISVPNPARIAEGNEESLNQNRDPGTKDMSIFVQNTLPAGDGGNQEPRILDNLCDLSFSSSSQLGIGGLGARPKPPLSPGPITQVTSGYFDSSRSNSVGQDGMGMISSVTKSDESWFAPELISMKSNSVTSSATSGTDSARSSGRKLSVLLMKGIVHVNKNSETGEPERKPNRRQASDGIPTQDVALDGGKDNIKSSPTSPATSPPPVRTQQKSIASHITFATCFTPSAVEHRSQSLRSEISVELETFLLRYQQIVSGLSTELQNLTLRELANTYGWNVEAFQKETSVFVGLNAHGVREGDVSVMGKRKRALRGEGGLGTDTPRKKKMMGTMAMDTAEEPKSVTRTLRPRNPPNVSAAPTPSRSKTSEDAAEEHPVSSDLERIIIPPSTSASAPSSDDVLTFIVAKEKRKRVVVELDTANTSTADLDKLDENFRSAVFRKMKEHVDRLNAFLSGAA